MRADIINLLLTHRDALRAQDLSKILSAAAALDAFDIRRVKSLPPAAARRARNINTENIRLATAL